MPLKALNASQNYYLYGGSDRYYFALEQLLTGHGHQVIPFAAAHPQNRPTPWARYFPKPVNFKKPTPADIVNYLYSCRAARSIRQLLVDERPDVAHLHIYYGQLTASILGPLRQVGIPILQHVQEYKLVCPTYKLLSGDRLCQECEGKHFWKAVANRCNRGSFARSLLSATEAYLSQYLGAAHSIDHFITCSRFVRDKLIELGLPAEKVTAAHNFTSTEGITPCSEPGEYFLYFGRLERLKGIFTVVKAAATLPQVPLLIVGTGEAQAELEEYIATLGCQHIHLLGFKEGNELQQLIRGAICTLAPSEWYEPFGLVLTESFAQARPVIASRIGGMTEIVSEGTDGYLIEPGDAEALARHMAWMAAHRREAVAMGMAGRHKIETDLSAERHYEILEKVYSKVL